MDEEAEIYDGFAETYDLFMDNIPYDEWHVYLHSLLQEYGVDEGIVVDLACGTGNMTRQLAAAGYDMIGIDQSCRMLDIAREKCPENVLLLQQDMRDLDLYGSVSAFICVCDGMNYLPSAADLRQVFHRVSMFLDPDGIFVFDMKTAYFYQHLLGNRTITDHREDMTLIWENEYHEESAVNEYLVTIYQLADPERDLFERIEEYHRQYAYSVEQVCEALQEEGLLLEAVYDAFTRNAPIRQSERIYYIVRKRK
ncbi:MAG: class I SAM-dependent methyltransferase [Lachnospiraceae bacterium]|nr:class I SAM-dependent methyltransferase [Lachnospiraceae bacterium]